MINKNNKLLILFFLIIIGVYFLVDIICKPCSHQIDTFNISSKYYFAQNTSNIYTKDISASNVWLNYYIKTLKTNDNISLNDLSKSFDKNSISSINNLLFVIDMQYDFCNPNGNFYVKEGEQTVNPIKNLIDTWDGPIVASIDYHPPGHCSFIDTNYLPHCSGPFPSHCTWSSSGARIHSDISESLQNKNAIYVYKGFLNNIDSFGAVKYNFTNYPCNRIIDCSMTGGYLLGDSDSDFKNLNYPDNNNMINVQNNIIKNNNTSYISIDEYINMKLVNIDKIFVVGLAGDFCVLDTVKNLKNIFTDKEIYYVINYTRVAWIPGKNNNNSNLNFNGGHFLTPPDTIAELGKSLCKIE